MLLVDSNVIIYLTKKKKLNLLPDFFICKHVAEQTKFYHTNLIDCKLIKLADDCLLEVAKSKDYTLVTNDKELKRKARQLKIKILTLSKDLKLI